MGFNLSTYLKVYLEADNAELDSSLNGYFLKIFKQSTGIYKIDLYNQSGNSDFLLGSDTVPFTDNVRFRLKITRKDTMGNQHNWKRRSDFTGNFDFINNLIDVNDTSDVKDSSLYFGFVCKYSSTHRMDFYFDDIYMVREKMIR